MLWASRGLALSPARLQPHQRLPWRTASCQPNRNRISTLSLAASGLTRSCGPGMVVVVLQWMGRFGVPIVVPGAVYFGGVWRSGRPPGMKACF